MTLQDCTIQALGADALEYDEPVERVEFHFNFSRREFVTALGAGLLIAVSSSPNFAQPQQQRGRGGRGGGGFFGGGAANIAARVHIGQDGTITVMTGKVECGQGSRAEITQAAAEELRVPIDRIKLI